MKFINPQMPRDYVVAIDTRTGEALDAWVGHAYRSLPAHITQIRIAKSPGKFNAMLAAEDHWRHLHSMF